MSQPLDFLADDWDPIGAANDGDDPYSPIPEGAYEAELARCELRTTKAGTGRYIAAGWRITGPSHAGRWIWSNLNIENQSERAAKIGLAQFARMCLALGWRRKPETLDVMVGKRCVIELAVREQNGRRDNEIRGYRAIDAAPVASRPTPSASKPSTKPSPWGV